MLNAVLNQRSQDMLAANGWNVCQYAILLMMVAQVNDMVQHGELVHVIADAHIYDRHVPMIQELLAEGRAPGTEGKSESGSEGLLSVHYKGSDRRKLCNRRAD